MKYGQSILIALIALFFQFALWVPLAWAQKKETRTFLILAINDVYRIEGIDQGQRGGLARLRTLRMELETHDSDLLLLHAGDLLFPSLLSESSGGGHMIEVLNRLDGIAGQFDEKMFVAFGNHEFDRDSWKHAGNLNTQISNSEFTWLGSNLAFVVGEDGNPVIQAKNLVRSKVVTVNGIRVGLLGLTTDIKDPEYLSFRKILPVTESLTTQLREKHGAEVVVAITHLPIAEDIKILQKLAGESGPDLIIGGHEHERQQKQVNGRWILKADADLRTATVVTISLPEKGPPLVNYEFRSLESHQPIPDPDVLSHVTHLLTQHDKKFCIERHSLPPGCLETPLGRTRVDLIAEELKIRKYETNLGNYVADLALAAFADKGAQAAFINSGSMRLNQNIRAGTSITRRHLEELFPYPTHLKMLQISGATLQKVISRSVEDWTGNGHWLQVSGFAFPHDPKKKKADRLTLLTKEGPRPIDSNEKLLVVVNEFLINTDGDQDGYSMLSPKQLVETKEGNSPVDLPQLVAKDIQEQGEGGIAPEVEGRICNTQKKGQPCLVPKSGAFTIENLGTAIEGLSTHILDYALLLAAAGTVVMALLELLKKVCRGRMWFHRYKVIGWFMKADEGEKTCIWFRKYRVVKGFMRTERRVQNILDEFYSLACGGRRNRWVLYDQPTEKMMGQIQAAANLALDFPTVYPKFYAFLAAGSSRAEKTTDQNRWETFSTEVSSKGILPSEDSQTRKSTQARARLGNLVTRKLDAFQSEVEYAWARLNQSLAVLFGTFLMYYLLVSAEGLKQAPLPILLVVSVLGGLVAPFAKDVVTALTGLKTKRS